MSVKTKETFAVDSPDSRDRNREKELAIDSTESGFFDAMLTFGWLAERHTGPIKIAPIKVIEVNDSLREWLRVSGIESVVDEIDRAGLEINEFLGRILQDEHFHVGEIVEGNLRWITETVELLNYEEVLSDVRANKKTYQLLEDSLEPPYTVQRTIRFVHDKHKASDLLKILAGVRVVAPAAIRLRSYTERDRVDLVSVCQVVREGNHWRVLGYQGLLQQAWLRVKSTIKAGTKEGSVALMGRNMSHNIGSHALFYMEMDEPSESKKLFYRYLRERMELLAGFATSMPLSSCPTRLSSVIEDFRKNHELLSRIAKSERVTNVGIKFTAEPGLQVALPGGILSAQALYAIFENNIRDSAKHGRTEGSTQSALELRINVGKAEAEFEEEFIKILVSDNRQNYSVAEKYIRKGLDGLRIVDEVGSLQPGDWGIKERFICAALLRGRRLEDIDIQLQKDRDQEIKYFIGDHAPRGEPRILDFVNVDGNLAWVFYLLKPKDILLIGNFQPEEENSLKKKFRDAINLYDFGWLTNNIAQPSKLRHKFVVVYVNSKSDITQLEAFEDKLPYRVIVCLPEGLTLPDSSNFAPITRDDLDLHNLSLGRLHQLWVNWLVDVKHPSTPKNPFQRVLNWVRLSRNSNTPQLAFNDDGLNVLKFDDTTGSFQWELLELKDYEPRRPVLLFDRHGLCKERTQDQSEESPAVDGTEWIRSCRSFQKSIRHYEAYEGGDALSRFATAATEQIDPASPDRPLDQPTLGFSFLEAGLTNILIVDERLDPTSEQLIFQSLSGGWQCTYKELFKWKGVDIRGGEYASNEIPSVNELLRWVKKADYDFLVLHKGIVDKLIKRDKKKGEKSAQEQMAILFASLHEYVRHIIIHSGRMSASELPPGVKFMSLSNVDTWLKSNAPKMQIVEDLYLLRRP